MKIVQLCGWYFPESLGGTETYVAALSSELRAAGHTVCVAAPDPGAGHVRQYDHDGIPVFRYPVTAAPTRAQARHDAPAPGAERLHQWLRTTAPDVVHLHTFVTGVGPHEVRAAKAAGARVIVTSHSGALGFLCQRGSLMHRGRNRCDGVVAAGKCTACTLEHRGMSRGFAAAASRTPRAVSRLLGRVPGPVGTVLGMPAFIDDNRRRQRDVLGEVHAFVVLTDWARTIVSAETPGAPVVVNRLGVRTPPPALPVRPYEGPIRVAYVGRFDDIKGIFDLARAVRAARDLPITVQFRGPQRTAQEQAVVAHLRAELEGDPRVTIADAIPPEQVYDFLGCVDVVCSPSLTLEGGPTVALEAMAAGVPVISTRLGAMAELLTDGVNTAFVAPGDWQALRDVLARIAADPDGTIGKWRTALPPIRTMADVARQYDGMYRG